MNQLTHGLNKRTEDKRDFQLGAIIKWPKLSELPTEYLCSPLSIKNQLADGNDDFCASCAGSGMIEPKEEVELYYPFLFAAAKYIEGGDPDSFGLELRSVGRALAKYGVPKISDVPQEVLNLDAAARRRFGNYPDSLREKALQHRAQSYFFVEGSPYDAYDTARAAQWYFREKKQNTTVGVLWGWQIEDFELTGFPNGFGHALWQAGWYEDGIRLVNSAGKEAGKEGFHKISRETFNKYAERYGMLMVVDLPKETAEYYIENRIKLGDSFLAKLWKALLNMLVYS